MRPKEHALQQQEETSLDETKNCFFCVQVSNASTEGRPHSGKSGLEGNVAVCISESNSFTHHLVAARPATGIQAARNRQQQQQQQQQQQNQKSLRKVQQVPSWIGQAYEEGIPLEQAVVPQHHVLCDAHQQQQQQQAQQLGRVSGCMGSVGAPGNSSRAGLDEGVEQTGRDLDGLEDDERREGWRGNGMEVDKGREEEDLRGWVPDSQGCVGSSDVPPGLQDTTHEEGGGAQRSEEGAAVEGRRDGGVVGKKRAGLEQALAVRVAGTKGAGSEQEHAAPLAKQRRLDDADEGRTLHASSPRQQRHAGSPPENPHGVQQTQQAQHGQHTQQQQGQTSQLFEVSSPVAATKSRPSMSNVTMQGGKGADGGHGSGSGGGDSVQQQPGQDSERGVQREGLRGGRGSGGEDSVHQCKSAVSRETEAVGSITVGGQGGVMGRRGDRKSVV